MVAQQLFFRKHSLRAYAVAVRMSVNHANLSEATLSTIYLIGNLQYPRKSKTE